MDRRDFLKALGGSAIAAIVGPLVADGDNETIELVESVKCEYDTQCESEDGLDENGQCWLYFCPARDVGVEFSEPGPYGRPRGVFASYFIDDEQQRRRYSGEL